MDSRKLQHVTALAREGSYLRAAAKLGITQSALTRSIQSLEHEIGLRLFDRGRGGAFPTEAGRQLADDGQIILRQMDVLRHNLAQLAHLEAGEVTFGMGPLPASLTLAAVLARVAREHRGLRVTTRLGSASELLSAVENGELDFVLLSQHFVERDPDPFTMRRIAQLHVSALVRKDHPLAGRTVTESDLQGWPVIGGSPGDAEKDAQPNDYAPTIICDNYDVMREVTLNSDAIWITANAAGAGDLVPLKGLRISRQVQIVVASLARRSLSGPALLLIEIAADAMRAISRDDASKSD